MSERDRVLFYIDGKVYSASLIDERTTDQFIEDRVHGITNQLVRDYIVEAGQLSNDEHTRIINEVNRTSITIPNDCVGIPVMAMKGQLCFLRNFHYAPTTITGLKSYWESVMDGDDDELFSNIPDYPSLSSDTILSITGRPKYYTTIMASFLENKIITSRKHYHSVGDAVYHCSLISWWNMCIGNTPATTYWNLPMSEFVKQVNTININSLGKSEMKFYNSSGEVDLRHYIEEMAYKQGFITPRGLTWSTT